VIRREDVPAWFEELEKKAHLLPTEVFGYDRSKAHAIGAFQAWMAEAETAIEAVFPPAHAIRSKWTKAENLLKPFNDGTYVVGDAVIGVFQAAVNLIQGDRLTSLLDLIRAETENDILEQSLALLKANHLAAAAVIAGGALDAHLRNLCRKYSLVVAGDGSISKYDQVIGQARNLGTVTVYSATDSKQVGGWGGMRNDAAHDPGAFVSSKDEVRRMIDGVKDFVSRTS
jgi:hypothetical protein